MNWENLIINLECIDNLPTLPTVFTKVTELINKPNVTARQIAEVIETDQAISMKLLKIVNSPFFGFSRKILTVQDAVVLLGFNATRNTVTSISIFNTMNTSSDEELFDMTEFWKHSIGTGMVARFLARKVHIDPENAFVAGIIHDIGKIILQQYFKDELTKVIKVMKEKNKSFFEAELEVYRGTHCDLGCYLADKWNLPFPLVEVIDLHHTPGEASEDPKLVSVIHIANSVTKGLGLGFTGWSKEQELDPYAFARLDIVAADLEGWLDEIQDEIDGAEEVFNLIK